LTALLHSLSCPLHVGHHQTRIHRCTLRTRKPRRAVQQGSEGLSDIRWCWRLQGFGCGLGEVALCLDVARRGVVATLKLSQGVLGPQLLKYEAQFHLLPLPHYYGAARMVAQHDSSILEVPEVVLEALDVRWRYFANLLAIVKTEMIIGKGSNSVLSCCRVWKVYEHITDVAVILRIPWQIEEVKEVR